MSQSDLQPISYKVNKDIAGTKSIRRALTVIRAVSYYNEQGARLSKIARKVDLHVSTVYRILLTLVDEGVLVFDSLTKRYRIGYDLYSNCVLPYQFTLKYQLDNVLDQIAQETGDTVFLFMRFGSDVVCIDISKGDYVIRASNITIGNRRPLGVGASSIAILANLPEDQMNKIISINKNRYECYPDYNIDKIKRLVSQTKKLGYSVFDRQAGYEYTSISVPVFSDKNDVTAAISVTAIHSRMSFIRQKQIVKNINSKLAFLSEAKE